jgi:hypothetical protein
MKNQILDSFPMVIEFLYISWIVGIILSIALTILIICGLSMQLIHIL